MEYNGTDRILKNIVTVNFGEIGLGTITPKSPLGDKALKCLGWTVSIPDKYKLECEAVLGKRRKTKKVHMSWAYATSQQQINFLISQYVPQVIRSYLSMVLVVFEQNSKGRVHMHCMCADPGLQNDYALNDLRAKIRQEYLPVTMVGQNMNKHLHLNYVHFIDDIPKWIEYLQKDVDKNDYPVICYS